MQPSELSLVIMVMMYDSIQEVADVLVQACQPKLAVLICCVAHIQLQAKYIYYSPGTCKESNIWTRKVEKPAISLMNYRQTN